MLRNFLFNLIYCLRKIAFLKARRLAFRIDAVKYLRNEGANIGDNCRWQSLMGCSEPYLLNIGNNVSVGNYVHFLTHEGAVWVIRNLVGDQRLELFGKIEIGDNVFIGNNSILFPETKVGDNVIIGAGSIVRSDIPSNSIVAGVPAKKIGDVDTFLKNNFSKCLKTKKLNEFDKKRYILSKLIFKNKF